MRSKIYQEIIAETPEEVERFVRLYAGLQLKVNSILEKKGITKEYLLQVSPAMPETSKWLAGKHNYSLRSLSKLSVELGEPLLEVSKTI